MRKTQLVPGTFYQTVTKLTQGSPWRSLPNVIELPVQSSHCVSFSIDYFTLTRTIEFGFCLYTLSLHHLGQQRHKKYFWYTGFYFFSKHMWIYMIHNTDFTATAHNLEREPWGVSTCSAVDLCWKEIYLPAKLSHMELLPYSEDSL